MSFLKTLPKELIDIPSLDDPLFMSSVLRLEREIAAEPTNRGNAYSRAAVARMYYNALQADGIPVPGMALLVFNAAQGWRGLPDQSYMSYVSHFDDLFLSLRRAHELRHTNGPSAIGRVEVAEPRSMTLAAREFTTIRVEYHVGSVPLRSGARIRFAGNWMNDMSPPQFSRPQMPGYTTVSASDPKVKLARGMENWFSVYGTVFGVGAPRPVVTVTEGELAAGDTVTFVIGDTGHAGPGLLVQSSATDAFPIRFEVDFDGRGRRFIVVGEPRFEVHGTAPHHLRVIAPTTVHADEDFMVRATVEDRYFNRAVGGPDRLSLWLDGKELTRAQASRSDAAVFRFQRLQLKADRRGPVVYEVRDREGRFYGRSNPVHLVDSDEPYVLWGDTHAHEGYTDGTGTAESVLRYARDVGFLDFACLTGHDILMSELYQRDVQRMTERYNEPGVFTTFKAYEWSQAFPMGGHNNVYYRDANRRIIPLYEAETLPELYRLQRRLNGATNVLIIPHCHTPGDWNFNDVNMARLIEIYSMHGRFEWFGRRFLERGYHMGLVASSDDHTGHPGNNPVRKGPRGGIVAVFAKERTREAIFDALVARRAYASTLARILLDTRVAGAVMGSEIELERREHPVIDVTGVVSGTAPIARITAVCNGKEVKEINLLESPMPGGAQGTAAVRVMIANNTEPATHGSQVLPPLNPERWWGRLTLAETTVSSVTGLGLEGVGDTFAQSGTGQVDFVVSLSGDQDGFLLELDRWAPDDTLTVQLFESTRTAITPDYPSKEQPLWGEVVTQAGATAEIRLGELQNGPIRRPLDERNAVYAERVGSGLSAFQEFSFSLSDCLTTEAESYVYVRCEQIDDETVWSSPVWISWR